MPNPFYEAQDQAAYDPSVGEVPAGAPAPVGVGGAPSMSQGVNIETPKFYAGSMGEIGQLRDAIMSQFPTINEMQDPSLDLTTTQKIGLIGLAVNSPQGALDLVRQKQQRHLKRKALAAEFNMKALGMAGEILKGQNEVQRTMAELRLQEASALRADKEQEYQHELQTGQQDIAAAHLELARNADRRSQAAFDQAQNFFSGGASAGGVEYDEGGNPMSVPGAAPSAGGMPGYGPPTVSVGPGGASMQFNPRDPVMNDFINFYKSMNPYGNVSPEQAWAKFHELRGGRMGSAAPPNASFALPPGEL